MRLSAPVELRQADDGPHLYGVLVQEGRAARRRREIFAPGSIEWPTEGVGVLTQHHGEPVARAIPTRESDGRITLRTLATDPIRRAVEGGRRFMSIEFHSLKEGRTEGGIREVLRALVPDVALVESPEYAQAGVEVRQGEAAELHLVLGPVAAGKSAVLAEMLRSGEIDLAADTTGLWASLALAVRDPETGRYPVRRADDPALAASLYSKTVVTRWALQNRYRVGVTASSPGAEAKWRQLAEELSAAFDVQVIDPGESTVTARLTDADGNIDPECTAALSRWYGSSRSAGLSTARRRLLAAI